MALVVQSRTSQAAKADLPAKAAVLRRTHGPGSGCDAMSSPCFAVFPATLTATGQCWTGTQVQGNQSVAANWRERIDRSHVLDLTQVARSQIVVAAEEIKSAEKPSNPANHGDSSD